MSEVLFNGPEGKLQGYYKHYEDSRIVSLILHPRECEVNSMENNIVSVLFDCFQENSFSTLKFNFRGVNKSEGDPDQEGLGEISDAATALDWLQKHNPDANICLIGGISFGSWVGSQLLMRRPEIVGFVNVAIPTNDFDFSFLSPCPASGLIFHPEKELTIDKKKITGLVRNLSKKNNIKITYKLIDSDINFKNKESQMKKEIVKFVSNTIANLEKS